MNSVFEIVIEVTVLAERHRSFATDMSQYRNSTDESSDDAAAKPMRRVSAQTAPSYHHDTPSPLTLTGPITATTDTPEQVAGQSPVTADKLSTMSAKPIPTEQHISVPPTNERTSRVGQDDGLITETSSSGQTDGSGSISDTSSPTEQAVALPSEIESNDSDENQANKSEHNNDNAEPTFLDNGKAVSAVDKLSGSQTVVPSENELVQVSNTHPQVTNGCNGTNHV